MSTSKKKKGADKELSEGTAIALTVLLFVAAIIAGYFLLKFVADFFFPNLFG